jgi:hypothetical protein
VNDITEIKKRLAKGLYIDNLNVMTAHCMQLARTTDEPLVFYLLAKIFDEIVHSWDGMPLTVEEAQEMQQRIGSALQKVLTSIDEERSSREIWKDLNALLRAFLH